MLLSLRTRKVYELARLQRHFRVLSSGWVSFSLLTTKDVDGDEQIRLSVLLLFYGSKKQSERKNRRCFFIIYFCFLRNISCQKGMRFKKCFSFSDQWMFGSKAKLKATYFVYARLHNVHGFRERRSSRSISETSMNFDVDDDAFLRSKSHLTSVRVLDE